jgi:hypothetical protein
VDKPTHPRLPADSSMDYDLTERVLRQLQDSHLHVFSTDVLSSLPDALATGSASDEHAGLVVTLTMLTDGRRGWLVLVDEVPEYDAPAELTELLGEVVGSKAGELVVRGANMDEDDPCEREHTLRLTDPARVRPEVERAYEAAFAGAAPVDHAAFLECFGRYHYAVQTERELRATLAELEG